MQELFQSLKYFLYDDLILNFGFRNNSKTEEYIKRKDEFI